MLVRWAWGRRFVSPPLISSWFDTVFRHFRPAFDTEMWYFCPCFVWIWLYTVVVNSDCITLTPTMTLNLKTVLEMQVRNVLGETPVFNWLMVYLLCILPLAQCMLGQAPAPHNPSRCRKWMDHRMQYVNSAVHTSLVKLISVQLLLLWEVLSRLLIVGRWMTIWPLCGSESFLMLPWKQTHS